VYINRLEINVAYPFLLQVFEDHENGLISKEELIKILKLIQSYVWRRFVVGLPSSSLSKVFMALYSEVDSEEYYDSIAIALLKKRGNVKFPSNEDVKTALRDKDLYNTQPKNRNYLFEMLENFNNREYVNTNNDQITIEHIFPRNPEEKWTTDLPKEEYFLFKEKHLNTIGNLTLSGNNGALSNKSFLAKKEMNVDGKEQGYQFSRLWLNFYIKSIDIWNIEKYEERLHIIYERFLKIWEYPDVVIAENDDTEEQNIFDAESSRNKKLEYFIFENTKVEEDAVAQMYFYVIRSLYEKNSQLLLKNHEILKMSRNAADFRTPKDVSNGWYIESNIDSNTKFNTLKKLLTLFGLEDELLIKYSTNDDNTAEPNRFSVRRKYWQQLLPLLNQTNLFENMQAPKSQWIATGSGIGGIVYTMVITKSFIRIELAFLNSSKELNKSYFKKLYSNKKAIEKAFGNQLEWEELPDNKMSRIKFELQEANLFNDKHWDRMNEFFVTYIPIFEKAFNPFIRGLK
jgi:hypothetical protein